MSLIVDQIKIYIQTYSIYKFNKIGNSEIGQNIGSISIYQQNIAII